MAKTRRPPTATKRPWVRDRPKGVVAASSAGGRRAQEARRTAARIRRSGRMRALLPERPRPCHRGGSTIGAGRGRCATVRARVPAMAETAVTTARLAAGAPAPRARSPPVRRGAHYPLPTRPGGAGGVTGVPSALLARLTKGEVLSAGDAAAREGLAALGAELAVPLELRGELAGVLTAGRKRSGLPYSAGDVEFLRALAHEAAIALENARSYEALVALNARLEERVRERTKQLEDANRELAEAYAELKNAEVQLVQSEKMAALGRLVAGVAHEINNPVAFISSSVAPLRRRLETAAADAPPEVAQLLADPREIVAVMARGAERTATIVKDLRSFSRLDEATRKRVDLHDGLEVSLRLLESRWRDRIEIHRDYGTLPPVECDPGQVNQVFMNVLANACDAIPERGNLWLTTRAEGDRVRVTIRDDGVGMAPEVVGRIFDPFFTTKEVGGGTGLGLAISQGVVAAHGGRIEVESAPGRGATFRIILPLAQSAASLDRAASGAR